MQPSPNNFLLRLDEAPSVVAQVLDPIDLEIIDIIDAGCTSPVPLTIIGAYGIPPSLADSLLELEGLGIDVGC